MDIKQFLKFEFGVLHSQLRVSLVKITFNLIAITYSLMLRNLSYLNLIFSVCYFLAYLQNGSPLVIFGLLSVVVYNWLILRSMEQQEPKRNLLQWLFGAVSLCFALYITYGDVVLVADAMSYHYYPQSTVILVTAGLLFALSIIFHLFKSYLTISVKKDD